VRQEESDGTGSFALIRRLFGDHLRAHLGKVVGAFLCGALAAAATAATAKVLEPVVDEVFASRETALLVPLSLVVLAIFVIRGVGTYGQAVLMNAAGRSVIAELQERMFARLMQSDLAEFHETAAGKLVSRFTFDVQQIHAAMAGGVSTLGKDALTIVFLIGVMFVQDPTLAALTFVLFPVAVIPIVRLGRRMRRVTRRRQTGYGQLSHHFTQVFQGIRHVKAYNAEAREVARADGLIGEAARLAQKTARIRFASTPIMEALAGVAVAAVILYGGSQVIDGVRTPGSFFSFIAALMLAYEPMKRLASVNAVLQQGLAALDRVYSLIDSRPTILDRPGAVAIGRAAGHVRLEDVHFAYGGVPALHGVTIDAPAGRRIALVGPSGAGKSTVLNLIPRFYDVGEGRVTVDGIDVRDMTVHSLREQIALVSQDVTLFDDTVRANIAYGRPEADAEAIEAAARAAAAHDFILALPAGYETVVGEHGVRLSGGQRQRISIARAMLKDAPILLLDEATSSLDTESERLVQDALDRLMRGRTTLVIAHRLSTVRSADHIYVLDAGRIVEQGTHAALVARGGLYARLWDLQTGMSDPDLGTRLVS
jgi:subfamily B ATP-binding cassette protein MsbA